jgi:hypothetical protein
MLTTPVGHSADPWPRTAVSEGDCRSGDDRASRGDAADLDVGGRVWIVGQQCAQRCHGRPGLHELLMRPLGVGEDRPDAGG